MNILVTGSSRGIGLAIARAFAAKGDNIMLNGKQDAPQLESAIAELRRDFPGVNVAGELANLGDYNGAVRLFRSFEANFGKVDVLVNNAGREFYGLFTEMPATQIQSLLADNLQATINISHLAIPGMVRAKSGCIISISSIWGVAGASCEAVYSAAKAGVIGFTKAIAKELAPSGICANTIACGTIETRMNANLSLEEKSTFIESIPLGRFGQPQEVAALALFLAHEAPPYLTGQTINLDGGLL
ncbi:MAG: SDR family oxidoreductase [Defluviitaleaceae bacterium]|nr:SDR family oxidoreductase [Defluviitaleaceae bacterium]